MNSFLILSLTCVAILIILLLLVAIGPKKGNESADKQFINEDGDHLYYDHRLIRHKKYLKQHPENAEAETPGGFIRSLFRVRKTKE
ncbi:MAG: hypothetical protein K2K77_00955 [Duncaniella sp.]|nr:hypothetical protein [Duncaniella sp.]